MACHFQFKHVSWQRSIKIIGCIGENMFLTISFIHRTYLRRGRLLIKAERPRQPTRPNSERVITIRCLHRLNLLRKRERNRMKKRATPGLLRRHRLEWMKERMHDVLINNKSEVALNRLLHRSYAPGSIVGPTPIIFHPNQYIYISISEYNWRKA